MTRGFRLLDGEMMQRVGGGSPLWAITDVRFAHLVNWPLHLRLERNGTAIDLVFDEVVSFRAEDESEILGHWRQRSEENVPVGTIYEIAVSTYLSEFASGTAGLTNAPIKHYLVAGYDLCVEVLATAPPRVAQVI